MGKKKNKKVVNVPKVRNHDQIQIPIKVEFEKEKKITPKDVFEGYGKKEKKK